MAFINIAEPYVKVSERIRQTPVPLNIDGTSNIGGVIVAPAGPRLSYVSGPEDFLKKYTVDGSIPRNADISLVNAYYLSFSAGLVLARSMNTTAVSGIYLVKKSEKIGKILFTLEHPDLWAVKVGEKIYWNNNKDKNFNNFLRVVTDLTAEDQKSPKYDSSKISAISAMVSNNVYCKDLYDLANKLTTETTIVTYSAKVGGFIVEGTDIDMTSETESNETVGFHFKKLEGENKDILESHPLKFKDGCPLNHKKVFNLTVTDETSWVIVMGQMAYYHGPIDRSKYEDYSLRPLNHIKDIAVSLSGINGLDAKVEPKGKSKTEFVLTVEYSEGNEPMESKVEGLIEGVTVNAQSPECIIPEGQDIVFYVLPKEPQESNVYKISMAPLSGNNFELTTIEKDQVNTYEVSFDPDAVDRSGNNVFIENLNALGLNFTFTTVPPEDPTKEPFVPVAIQSFAFGDSGLKMSLSESLSCKIDALYTLQDQELYDIEYLAPLGECNLQWLKHYAHVGKIKDQFTPVDIPADKTNQNSIKGFCLNVEKDSNVIVMGPFDKNSGLTGWINYIAASTLYYTKVMKNRALKAEWAPVFDITNGVLDYTNPVFQLGTKERTALLNFDAPVNFVIFNQRANLYYFNDNRTHQTNIDVMSEEQNRRLVNKIKKDAVRLLGRFKGRFNTTATRLDVESLLHYYFSTQIMNQRYKPESYLIKCDATNNTKDIIVANKLAVYIGVRLYNAIKYVDVLVDVFPLSVDFNS